MQSPIYAERVPLDSQQSSKWGMMDYANAFARYTSDLLVEKPRRKIDRVVVSAGYVLLTCEEAWEAWRVGSRVQWVGSGAGEAVGVVWGAPFPDTAPLLAVAAPPDGPHYPLKLFSLPRAHYANTLRLRAPVLGLRMADLLTVTHAHCILVFDENFNKLYEVRTQTGPYAHYANSLSGSLLAYVAPAETNYWADLTRNSLAYLAEKTETKLPVGLPEEEGEVVVCGRGGEVCRVRGSGQAVAWAPSGTLLAVAGLTGQHIALYRLHHGPRPALTLLHLLTRGLTNALVHHLAWSPDEYWLTAASTRGTVHLFAVTPTGETPCVETHLRLPGLTGTGGQALARIKHSAGLAPCPTWLSPTDLLVIHDDAATQYSLRPHVDLETQQQRKPPKLAARLVAVAEHRLIPPQPPSMAWQAPAEAKPTPKDWVSQIDIVSCRSEPLWNKRKIHFRILSGEGPFSETSPSTPVVLNKVSVAQVQNAEDVFSSEGLVRGATLQANEGILKDMSAAISTPLNLLPIPEQPAVQGAEELRAALARSMAQPLGPPISSSFRLDPPQPAIPSPILSPLHTKPELYPSLVPTTAPEEKKQFRFAFADSDSD